MSLESQNFFSCAEGTEMINVLFNVADSNSIQRIIEDSNSNEIMLIRSVTKHFGRLCTSLVY